MQLPPCHQRLRPPSCHNQVYNIIYYYYYIYLLPFSKIIVASLSLLLLLSTKWFISYRSVVAVSICLSLFVIFLLSVFCLPVVSVLCVSNFTRWMKHNKVCLVIIFSSLSYLLLSICPCCLASLLVLFSIWCISYRWWKYYKVLYHLIFFSMIWYDRLLYIHVFSFTYRWWKYYDVFFTGISFFINSLSIILSIIISVSNRRCRSGSVRSSRSVAAVVVDVAIVVLHANLKNWIVNQHT
jgi:hypothetical protein